MQPLILPPQSQPLALPNNRLDITYYLFLQAIRDAIARGAEMVQFGSSAARKAFNTVGLPNGALWLEDDTGLIYQWRVIPGVSMGWVDVTPAPVRGIAFVFDGGGSALSAGKTIYLRIPFACTLQNWSIESTTAETVTVKFWRVAAGGTAIPTSGNSISTSGVSLASGTAVFSTTMSDFTSVAIAANDLIACSITAVTASEQITVVLGAQ